MVWKTKLCDGEATSIKVFKEECSSVPSHSKLKHFYSSFRAGYYFTLKSSVPSLVKIIMVCNFHLKPDVSPGRRAQSFSNRNSQFYSIYEQDNIPRAKGLLLRRKQHFLLLVVSYNRLLNTWFVKPQSIERALLCLPGFDLYSHFFLWLS